MLAILLRILIGAHRIIFGSMTNDTNSEFGAWTTHFNDISRFLEGAERQYGIANANF